jgi:hypothetical protein
MCKVTEDLPHELLGTLEVAGHQRDQLHLFEKDDSLCRVQSRDHPLSSNGFQMAAPKTLDAGCWRPNRNPHRTVPIYDFSQLLRIDLVGSGQPHPLHGFAGHHSQWPRGPCPAEPLRDSVDTADVGVRFCAPDNDSGMHLVKSVSQPFFGSLPRYRSTVEHESDRLAQFGLTVTQYRGPLGAHHLHDTGDGVLDIVADRPGRSVQKFPQLLRFLSHRKGHIHQKPLSWGVPRTVGRCGYILETSSDEIAGDVDDLLAKVGFDASAGISQILGDPVQNAGLKCPLS